MTSMLFVNPQLLYHYMTAYCCHLHSISALTIFPLGQFTTYYHLLPSFFLSFFIIMVLLLTFILLFCTYLLCHHVVSLLLGCGTKPKN